MTQNPPPPPQRMEEGRRHKEKGKATPLLPSVHTQKEREKKAKKGKKESDGKKGKEGGGSTGVGETDTYTAAAYTLDRAPAPLHASEGGPIITLVEVKPRFLPGQ